MKERDQQLRELREATETLNGYIIWREQLICNAWAAKISAADIATAVGLSRQRIYQIVKDS